MRKRNPSNRLNLAIDDQLKKSPLKNVAELQKLNLNLQKPQRYLPKKMSAVCLQFLTKYFYILQVEARKFNGEDIPVDQPLLVSGGIMRDYQLEGKKIARFHVIFVKFTISRFFFQVTNGWPTYGKMELTESLPTKWV